MCVYIYIHTYIYIKYSGIFFIFFNKTTYPKRWNAEANIRIQLYSIKPVIEEIYRVNQYHSS